MLYIYIYHYIYYPPAKSVHFGFFEDFGSAWINLVVVSLLINLVYYCSNFFPQDFNLLFQTNLKSCKKNILFNGFK